MNETPRTSFRVTIALPVGASKAAAKQYIKDAVQAYCGGLSPEDPMFKLKRHSVTVVSINAKIRRGQSSPKCGT